MIHEKFESKKSRDTVQFNICKPLSHKKKIITYCNYTVKGPYYLADSWKVNTKDFIYAAFELSLFVASVNP